MFTYDEIFKNYTELLDFLRKDSYRSTFEEISKTVVRREQATGGGTMHRGFYCPSIVEDIIIGNVNRGRIIKRLVKQPITYTYGFDGSDRLVTVIKHTETGDVYEYIIYADNIQYGVVYGQKFNEEWLENFSKCCYDGKRLKSYDRYVYDHFSDALYEYFGEIYNYGEDRLEMEQRYCLNSPPEVVAYLQNRKFKLENPYLQNKLYKFKADNGFLTEYTSYTGNVYQIKKKRKISE